MSEKNPKIPGGILIQVEPGYPHFIGHVTPGWYDSQEAHDFASDMLKTKIKYKGGEPDTAEISQALSNIRHASEVGEVIRSNIWGYDPSGQAHHAHSQTLVDTEIPIEYQLGEEDRIRNIAAKANQAGYAVIVHAAGADGLQEGLPTFTPEYRHKREYYEEHLECPNMLICRAAGNYRKPEINSAQSGVVLNDFANDVAVGVGTKDGITRAASTEGDNGVDLFTDQRAGFGAYTSFTVPYVGVYAKKLMDEFHDDIPSHYVKLAMLQTAQPKSNQPGTDRTTFEGEINAAGLPWGIHEGAGYLDVPRKTDAQGLSVVDTDAVAQTPAYKLLTAWRGASKVLAEMTGKKHAGFPDFARVELKLDKPVAQPCHEPTFASASVLTIPCPNHGNPLNTRLSFNMSDESKAALKGSENRLEIFLRSPKGTIVRLKSKGTIYTEGRLTTSAFTGEDAKGDWQMVMQAEGVDPAKLTLANAGLWLKTVPPQQDISRIVKPEMLSLRKYGGHVTELPFYKGNVFLNPVKPPDEKKLREIYIAPLSPELKAVLRHYMDAYGSKSDSLTREPFSDAEVASFSHRYTEKQLTAEKGAALFGQFDAPFVADLATFLKRGHDPKAQRAAATLRKGLAAMQSPAGDPYAIQAMSETLVSLQSTPPQALGAGAALFGGKEHLDALMETASQGASRIAQLAMAEKNHQKTARLR